MNVISLADRIAGGQSELCVLRAASALVRNPAAKQNTLISMACGMTMAAAGKRMNATPNPYEKRRSTFGSMGMLGIASNA